MSSMIMLLFFRNLKIGGNDVQDKCVEKIRGNTGEISVRSPIK